MKKPNGTSIFIGVSAVVLTVCVVLMCQFYSLWQKSGYKLEWKRQERVMTPAEAARNADTSNFDNVLRF